MFFFRIELSSFDDEKKILFIVSDMQDADENGIPVFSEKTLTSHTDYKQFVKDTKTSVVDVRYALCKTDFEDTVVGELNEETYIRLQAENAVEIIDGNEFSIAGGKSPKSGGKKNMQMYLILGIAAAFVLFLIIASALKGSPSENSSDGSTAEATAEATTEAPFTIEASATAELAETAEPETRAESAESGEYIDIPQTEEIYYPETIDNEYTDSGYSDNSGGGGSVKSEYTISFHANGGEGTIESISSAPEQYVVLPNADEAAKSLSREGYKLIGFSDNVEINYPLYDYKMPYNNVTLYAVWETDEFTVTYNSNGGTGQLSSVKVKYGEDVPMPTEIAVYKSGLNLAGWHTDKSAATALKTLKMPAENITLYAVWSEKKPTAKVTFHYDDSVMVQDVEKGTLDMRQDFGIVKDGYMLSGWYLENSPQPLDYLEVTEDCDVYGKWERATYITISIDQSYLNKAPLTYNIPLDMNGEAALKLPKVNDRSDNYNHVYGCTYGFSTKEQSGEFGTIEYYGDTEYKFKKDITLYRVLNRYGGGKGTESNPYIIDYYDQLLYLAENKASGYFIQTADIKFPNEAERTSIDTVKISRGYEDKFYNLFVYDGQGYKIQNLRGEGGLFGTLAASNIRNVNIDGAKITVSSADGGILCNTVTSYTFGSYSTGNSRFLNCRVTNSTITTENSDNIGCLVGNGGVIENCVSESNSIRGSAATMGGIVGNACTVSGCLSNKNSIENGDIIGGIAGSAFGAEVFENNTKVTFSGDITGCGVNSLAVSGADYCGGIVGQTSGLANGYIRSCYVANIYLNGNQIGSISGGDSNKSRPHIIAYCIADNTNDYPPIGGSRPRSKTARMVLSVPEDGLKVDGVLAVLNARGSGYSEWYRDNDINGGYPYTDLI